MVGLVIKSLQELINWIDHNVEMVSDAEQVQRNKSGADEANFFTKIHTLTKILAL